MGGAIMGDGERMEEEKEGDQHPTQHPFSAVVAPMLICSTVQRTDFCLL